MRRGRSRRTLMRPRRRTFVRARAHGLRASFLRTPHSNIGKMLQLKLTETYPPAKDSLGSKGLPCLRHQGSNGNSQAAGWTAIG